MVQCAARVTGEDRQQRAIGRTGNLPVEDGQNGPDQQYADNLFH
jgi:hypothetical protein